MVKDKKDLPKKFKNSKLRSFWFCKMGIKMASNKKPNIDGADLVQTQSFVSPVPLLKQSKLGFYLYHSNCQNRGNVDFVHTLLYPSVLTLF